MNISPQRQGSRPITVCFGLWVSGIHQSPVIFPPLEGDGASEVFEQHLHMVGICVAEVNLVYLVHKIPGVFEIVLLEKIDLHSLIRAGLAALNDKYLHSQ